MAHSKQRGSRVIYVAASARQLPQPVQDWLGQASNAAAACPHIYDALAMLATGKRPAALIVGIEAVDWNEMEFFEHALRLSPHTLVYVTGPQSQQAKMDAACSRGAHVFDPEAVDEELRDQPEVAVTPGPAGLLAGSLRSSGFAPASGRQPDPDVPTAERPAVRLVSPAEQDDVLETPVAGSVEPPVPFPWAPSPNRPQRTPPAGRRPPAESSEPAASRSASAPKHQVKLTAEEVAALLQELPRAGGPSSQEMQP